MLSRSAQGLYWMGRYLERAQRLCVLLELQAQALVDRPIREIYFGWHRIYDSIYREPPASGLGLGVADDYALANEFTLADAFTLADDLTFERANPDSVWSCFQAGRENARQMRHCISAEMWTRLNLAYLRLQRLDLMEIWTTSPESFYAETAAEINTFAGVAAATMYRDEGWSFMQLGRSLERAQLTCALLRNQLAAAATTPEDADADWTSLLRACHALEAYNRRYSGVAVEPGPALDLLVADTLLPTSLLRSVELTAAELTTLGPGPDAKASAAGQRLVGRAAALISYDWPDRADDAHFLEQVSDFCRELHNLIAAAYFDYPIATAPAR